MCILVSYFSIFFKDLPTQISGLKMNSKLPVFVCISVVLLSVCHFCCGAAAESPVDGLSWSCVNNASCIKALSDDVLQKLRERKPVQLGGITVEPLSDSKGAADPAATFSSARSMSFSDILNGNAITIPLGPMLLSLQRSDEYKNYLELALLRKASEGKTWFKK